ncbi:hypothetical protein [Clostridium botulinum]|uniref:hypothetical protein n=1 Tax=Clostridium botulinum TaxID=1491 RepID=UPI0013F00EDF|nr:hypothetical protein [Clostridium botulinum]MBY6950338.1 hypothetical protein [Clostridium botulinum]MCR1138588.1 hypothetical protein [Clostridium botulinum]NEZ80062.1 hypothetical protein [Clostridium botulinum]NFA16779.1 hypothetical protein [Clostridium botulinum]NFA54128.1 hypothetical protein [Clostridium botulinum]
MKESQNKILNDAYDNYSQGSNRHAYSFDIDNPKAKQDLLMDLNYLEDKGLIEITAHALGLVNFKLTSYGIDYMEDSLPEPISPITINQAPNSINVLGDNNTITDNYNNLKIEIENADIPEEYKKLLISFTNEIKESNISKKDLKSKVNNLVYEILTGTTTGIATSILSTFLTTFFLNLK